MTDLDRRQAGNATVGMVIVVPVIMLLALLVVGLGRTVSVQQSVTGAARSAARAASLADSSSAAFDAAQQAAEAALAGRCEAATITPQLGEFTAGGQVTVAVVCVVSLSDAALAGLPGHATLSASATAPIEQLRKVGP